jgi:hypothetical protein
MMVVPSERRNSKPGPVAMKVRFAPGAVIQRLISFYTKPCQSAN